MEDSLQKFIAYIEIERSLSPFTVRNYTSDIRSFFEFLRLEQIGSLGDVDHALIRLYLGQLLEHGVVRSSISRKMSTLRTFYRYLNRQGIVDKDPLSKIAIPKREKRLPDFLTTEEIISLLSAPDTSKPEGLRDLAILELLYASGLRISEIASLDTGHISLETREVRVWGKGSKERIVLMGLPAIEILSQYMAIGRPKLLGHKRTNALFLNRYGNRIAQRRIQYLLKKYAEKAGISGRVHPHMLRHTFATHMLDGGADLRVVQELLGHEHLSSTQIYTHVTRSQMRSRYLEAHPRSQETEKTPRRMADQS